MIKSQGPDGKYIQADFDAMDRYAQVTDKAGKTWKFTYDSRGRLAGLTGINGVTLGYDGLNGLYSRQAGGVTTNFHHQYAIPMGPVIVEKENGSAKRYFIWTVTAFIKTIIFRRLLVDIHPAG
jgi:YD repeat-containing protein